MPNQRMVALRPETYDHLLRLRRDLAEKAGRDVGIGEAVGCALDCMADAHGRGAWLGHAVLIRAKTGEQTHYRKEGDDGRTATQSV